MGAVVQQIRVSRWCVRAAVTWGLALGCRGPDTTLVEEAAPSGADSGVPGSCQGFRDAPRLTSEADGLRVVNDGDAALYIEPTACDEPGQTLVGVRRDGQYLELSPICVAGCQMVIDQGWVVIDQADQEGYLENDGCAYNPCRKFPVRIEPGQTLVRTSTLEFALRRLPRECAAGITTEAVNCLSLVDSAPGNYTLELSANMELTCYYDDSDCECHPGPDGTCTNPNVYLRRTPLTISENVSELSGQTLTISRRRGCDGLLERINTRRDLRVSEGELLPTAQPCGPLTAADFQAGIGTQRMTLTMQWFEPYCADYASFCED